MSTPEHDKRFDYLEISTPDPAAARAFYEAVFGWSFQDFGPDYTAWNDGRMTGGFERGLAPTGGVLPVIYATDLAEMEAKVVAAGGTVVVPVFSFPGGRRFEFVDPTGVKMAVWSQ